MANRAFALIIVAGLLVMLAPLVTTGFFPSETNELAEQYLAGSDSELAAANAVTAIVVTYRGLDTLGEVTVLFAATVGVGFVLTRRRNAAEEAANEAGGAYLDDLVESPPGDQRAGSAQGPSEILATGSKFLAPLLTLFGIYIFVHGHLTPGGGFQGGVIIAAGVVLSVFGNEDKRLRHGALAAIESLSGVTYVVLGLLGIILAAGFLDPRFLPIGSTGRLMSAGAIPLIYSVVGLKVGSEIAGVVDRLREQREGGH